LGENHIQADAIVTDKENVLVLMLFADCVPILFYDPRKNVIACAHGGWQGTFKGIAAETVKTMMRNFQSQPRDILAAIGPSICENHYEVGSDVVAAANQLFHPKEGVVIEKKGRFFANLQLANQILLERVGVEQIEQSEICTMCHAEDWFSHRCEHGRTGRFGAVITLKK
jgi:YfiH family protein